MDNETEEQIPIIPQSPRERAEKGSSYKSLFAFVSKSHVLPLTEGIVLSLLLGGFVPTFAFLLGRFFEDFAKVGAGSISGERFGQSVATNTKYLIGLGAASCVLNAAFYFAWVVFGELQGRAARGRLFSNLARREVGWFERQGADTAAAAATGGSSYLARLQAQARELQLAASQPVGLLVQYAVTCVAALGLAFWNAWDLTLVVLATVPVAMLAVAWMSGRIQPSIERQTEDLARATRQVQNVVEAIGVVKSFNAQYSEALRYLETIESAAAGYMLQARWNAIQVGFVRTIIRTLFVQGFWYGSHLVQTGHRTAGQILTAFWGCLMATQTFEQVLPQTIVLRRGKVAASSLEHFLTDDENVVFEDIDIASDRAEQVLLEGDILFQNVKFAYPSRPEALSLNGVTLFIPAKKTTYLVGRSGSGKSTLAGLLLGMYDDWNGQITIDGMSIRGLSPTTLRQNIVVLSQETVLFNDSLLQNIVLGRSEESQVPRIALDESMQTAHLGEVMKVLPRGLRTVLGAKGTSLSGGQTQRVAIARSRFRDPPILILDECTSALDKKTSVSVMNAISRWRQGKTTIIITHDIAQVGQSDFTCVFDDGRAVQQGRRCDLERDKNSLFASFSKAARVETELPMPNPRSGRTGTDIVLAGADIPRKPLPAPFPTPPSTGGTKMRRNAISEDSQSPSLSLSSSPSLGSRTPPRETALQMALPLINVSSNHSPSPHLSRAASIFQQSKGDEFTHRGRQSSGINIALSIQQYKNARDDWLQRQQRYTKIDLDDLETNEMTDSIANDIEKRAKQKKQQQVLSLSRILGTIWTRLDTRRKRHCCLGFVFAIAHAACTPVFSFIFSDLLTTYYMPADSGKKALRLSLTLLGVSFADGLSAYFSHYLLESAAQFWVDNIRFDVMRRILDQPQSWFESADVETLELVDHLNTGAELMRNLLGRFVGYLFVAVTMMSIGLVWSLVISWRLTLVGISMAPVMYLLTLTFDVVSNEWEAKSYRAIQAAHAVLSEVCEKIKTVKSFSLELHFLKKHDAASKAALMVGVRRAAASSPFFGLSDAGIFFVTALTFWYGSTLVTSSHHPVDSIITVFSMLLFVVSNVNALISFMPQLGAARHTATSLLELTHLSSLGNHEHAGDTHINTLSGSIWFRRVCFRYASRPDHLALNCLTLEIPRQQLTAIVGASGSGKSTVISLILRLYSLSEAQGSGSLKVGDVPLSQLDAVSWRSLLAYVPQQPRLIAGTLADNIAYGLAQRSPYRHPNIIRNAAVHSGIDAFISSLPQGYATVIGEGGTGLSGGQMQKVAIARAIIRRPKLLILDEPTSAMDATSAEEIRSLLSGLVEVDRMTVVVVTHSPEMMRAMDRIAVLDKGRVVEQGTFNALMARKGHLRRLLGEDGVG